MLSMSKMDIKPWQFIPPERLPIMKKFDAVKMVREIRDKMYSETKKMSDKELIEYFRHKQNKTFAVKEKRAPYSDN